MTDISQLRDFFSVVAVVVGLLSGITTGLITIVGLYFAVKFKLASMSDQILEVKRTLSSESGHGLCEQVSALREEHIARSKIEKWLFDGEKSVNGRIECLDRRVVCLEAKCLERHGG